MFDYVVSLREGIMDAWGGIIGAMKGSDQGKQVPRIVYYVISAHHIIAALLHPYIEPIFHLLNTVWLDQNRSEGLLRSSMGVIG